MDGEGAGAGAAPVATIAGVPVGPLVEVLGVLGVEREDVHARILKTMVEALTGRVSAMSTAQAMSLLEASFKYVSAPQLQPVVVAVLQRLEAIPAPFMAALAKAPAVLSQLPVSLQQQVWGAHPSTFEPELSTLVARYVGDCTPLHSSARRRKDRRSHAGLLALTTAIGSNVSLFRCALEFLLEQYKASGHPRLAMLRIDLILWYHDNKVMTITAVDRCASLAVDVDGMLANDVLTQDRVEALFKKLQALQHPQGARAPSRAPPPPKPKPKPKSRGPKVATSAAALAAAATRKHNRGGRGGGRGGSSANGRGVKRKTVSTSPDTMAAIRASLAALNRQDKGNGSWFQLPVTDKVVPGYSRVIKRPMDLSTISSKTSSHYVYYDDFTDDVDLMLSNALKFNGKFPQSPVCVATRAMMGVLDELKQRYAGSLPPASFRKAQHAPGGAAAAAAASPSTTPPEVVAKDDETALLHAAIMLADPYFSATLYRTLYRTMRDSLSKSIKGAVTLPQVSPLVNYCLKLASIASLANVGDRAKIVRELTQATNSLWHLCCTSVANAMLDHITWQLDAKTHPSTDDVRDFLIQTESVALKLFGTFVLDVVKTRKPEHIEWAFRQLLRASKLDWGLYPALCHTIFHSCQTQLKAEADKAIRGGATEDAAAGKSLGTVLLDFLLSALETAEDVQLPHMHFGFARLMTYAASKRFMAPEVVSEYVVRALDTICDRVESVEEEAAAGAGSELPPPGRAPTSDARRAVTDGAWKPDFKAAGRAYDKLCLTALRSLPRAQWGLPELTKASLLSPSQGLTPGLTPGITPGYTPGYTPALTPSMMVTPFSPGAATPLDTSPTQ